MDSFVVSYLDDILIYSKTDEEHEQHVRTVLTKLASAGAILNLQESFFGLKEVELLGHVVSEEGISIKPAYVDVILERPFLKDIHDVNSFCGLINFFKAWIPKYAEILEPLNRLRKKSAPFSWTTEAHTAVRVFQFYLTSAPVLDYFDPEQLTTVYCDASECAVGGWIGQRPKVSDVADRPILFYSRKLKAVGEVNYGTHERELLALVEMLRTGRP